MIYINKDPLVWAIFPAMILGWVLISGLVSLIGGWFNLARKYPIPNDTGTVLDRFTWRSLNLNYLCAYSSCIIITFTNLGIILQPILLFRFLHKPIFIRWGDISNLENVSGILKSIRIVFYLGKTRIALFGEAAKRILLYHRQHRKS